MYTHAGAAGSFAKFNVTVDGNRIYCTLHGPRGWLQVKPKPGVLAELMKSMRGNVSCGTGASKARKVVIVNGAKVVMKDPVFDLVSKKGTTVINVRSGSVIVGREGQGPSAVVVGAGWQAAVVPGRLPLSPARNGSARATNADLKQLTKFLPAASDHTPPTVKITGPDEFSQSTSATLMLAASEAHVTYSCALDSVDLRLCTDTQHYSRLARGKHTFVVRAVDRAGNTGPAAFFTWTVDDRAPVPTITNQQPAATSATSATFRFTADEPRASFTCRLDSGDFELCASPKTYSGLTAGTHSFWLVATDDAGNSSAPTTVTWSIDLRVPVVTIPTRPDPFSASASATFTFTADKAPVTFACSLDLDPAVPCSSPQTYTALADGTHRLAVSAKDAVGNIGQTEYSWVVDTVAPSTTITGGPDKLTYSFSATFTFAANEKGASFACRLDNGVFSACSSPKTYSNLSGGSHTVTVRATDAAGNVERSGATYTWTVVVIG